jgi:hypothetical protein
MMPKADVLFEGSYLYFNKEVNYCQENFQLVQLKDLGYYHIYADILSRVETGEFLKVIVRFEMTNHFIPFFLRIEKSIGDQYVQESFRIDQAKQELLYTFEGPQLTQEFKKTHSSKHYLVTPAFSTSLMWTLSRKMNPIGRTPVTLVSSTNNWTYKSPPLDKTIFAEYKSLDVPDYKLNNTSLEASHLCLYENDTSSTSADLPVEVFVSKHFAIPYQLIQGDLRINIKTLKRQGN